MSLELDRIVFAASGNFTPGRRKSVSLVVIHYTASGVFDSTVNYLVGSGSRASAHYVIARNPSPESEWPSGIVQLVNLQDTAWHSGRAVWRGTQAVNAISIGIELVNWGPLKLTDHGYKTWTGTYADLIYPISPENWPEFHKARYWQPFTEFQYKTLRWLIAALEKLYKIEDVLGHEDVAPGRKEDPGPAFKWSRLRITPQLPSRTR